MIEYTFRVAKSYDESQIKVIQKMLLDTEFLEDYLFGKIMSQNTHNQEDLIPVDTFLLQA